MTTAQIITIVAVVLILGIIIFPLVTLQICFASQQKPAN